MYILAMVVISVGIAFGIAFIISLFDYSIDFSFLCVTLVVSVLCLLLSYNLFKLDIIGDEKRFITAIETKTYKSNVTEVQGVYKDKIVAGDKQYNIDLNYCETKNTTELKPNDPIRITYIVKRYGGNIVIKIEKLLK